MGIKGAITKNVKKVVKAPGKAVRKGARAVGESVPGYGSYAKTIRKQLAENKRTASANRGR